MAAAFDTLTAARRMEDAGMKREQAEAVAEAVRTAAEADLEHLATKADLGDVKAELKADLAVLKTDLGDAKAELKADLAVLKTDLGGVKAELKADVAVLKTDLADVRAELVDRIQSGERRMYAAVFGVGGLLFAALKLVP